MADHRLPLTEVRTAHTADLDTATRKAARAPLDLSGELTCDWRDGDVW